jgi:hypothetical protein
MTIRNWLKEPRSQIRAGLVFLILASLWKWLLTPDVVFSVDATDGITGLLYGVSIGFMLLGIWRKSRQA